MKVNGTAVISFISTDPKVNAEILNEYVSFASEFTKNQLIIEKMESINHRIKLLKLKIHSRKTMASIVVKDEITKLTEALKISQLLNIVDSYNSFNEAEKLIYINSMPLYYRGSKALSAEIESLKSRNSYDSYIPGLRNLETMLIELNDIMIDIDSVSVIKVNELAIPSSKAFKPNRLLIIFQGLILGIVLGLVTVLFFYSLRKNESS